MRHISIALLWFGLGFSGAAQACTCWHPEPEEYLRSASLAFRGRVVAVKDSGPGASLPPGSGSVTLRGPQSGRIARFRVETLFKGKSGYEVQVGYTESDGANCGWGFKEGQEVTVLASGIEGDYSTSMCMMIPYASYTRQGDRRYADALDKYKEQREGYVAALAGAGPKEPVLRAQAAFFHKYNDFAEAEGALSALLALRPADSPALAERGDVRYAGKHYAQALADYSAALAVDPDHAQARRGRTLALTKLDRVAELAPADRDFTGFDTGYEMRPHFAGIDLRGAKFRGAQLNQIDFSNADLRGADYTGSSMHTTIFKGAKLAGARFDDLKQTYQTSFEEADLRGASFKGASLFHARLNGADLSRTDFGKAHLESASLEDAKLDQANFKGASMLLARLTGTRWSGQDLSGADLRGADLRNAVFHRVNLRDAQFGASIGMREIMDLRGTDLSSADLTGVKWGTAMFDCHTKLPARVKIAELPLLALWGGCAGDPPRTAVFSSAGFQHGPSLSKLEAKDSKLAGVSLNGFSFWSVNFAGSDFTGAQMADLDIQGGNYENANFKGAVLTQASISNVTFKGASFENAVLIRTRLIGVDMSQSRLAGADLTGLCYDPKTIWPAGFDPKAAGAREVPANIWCASAK